MTNWLEKNKKTLIRSAFLVPIISVAAISISHVVSWYNLANPVNWAIYLSIAVEIAAMSAIAAASVKIRGFSVWFVFGIVTLIQFIGNIYFSYTEIDVSSQSFKDWIDLTAPITSALGNDLTDVVAQRRFLAILEGGLLPLISLTCLHFFIGYSENLEQESKLDTGEDLIEPIAQEKEIEEDVSEVEITPNIEQEPEIDNIEDLTESTVEPTEKPEIAYPQPATKKQTNGTGPKVDRLSLKMKKILGK